ncbi:MAG: hypothetical protein LBG24_10395 [Treponema sp.]|nr:hypothetical protein [Treponema sp.]
MYQDANKGFSPPETRGRDYQIWEWPLWERQSIALNGAYAFNDISLDVLVYFDSYANRLDEYYSWDTYVLEVHNGHSDYDEYTTGGRITGKWDISPQHTLQAALTYKKEDHQGLWREALHMHVNEDTWSLGGEYGFTPFYGLTLRGDWGLTRSFPLTIGEKKTSL